ncbi:hypothetical protein IWQ57_001102 [Coemansia nantahalensis]|uniref:Uncharacterized protein n=2 Tax=Coemansia TaxID=4863 RepID=A0ACC1LF69_9FUNG|nr:hypothetical protein IWQ57_001102 [Coemansia nantahalensis]KAJ2806912.1 hypothetical protein H4R21_000682 [Coemansia helicoidea]
MRATLANQAKALYKWHRHVPLVKFIGPRKELWAQKAAELRAAQPAAAQAAAAAVIQFWELPARYRPLPVSDAEIEAIESGGASLV